MGRDFKADWDTTVESTTEFAKKNSLLTGVVLGGAAGTILIPIPILGTIVGAFLGAHVARKIEDKGEDRKANEKLKKMGELTRDYCDVPADPVE